MKPPYIAFTLEDAMLATTTVNGLPPKHTGKPFTIDFAKLESLNERGLESSATLIGKFVIGSMNIWHPDVFEHFPNLQMPHPDTFSKDTFPPLRFPPDGDDEK